MSEPNNALAALAAEAGWSWAGLARRINHLAASEGRALRYDYTAVHRWVKKGEKPRSPVPMYIAQALSERLGRRVRPTDFGMLEEESVASRGLQYGAPPLRTLETIIDLGKVDAKRPCLPG